MNKDVLTKAKFSLVKLKEIKRFHPAIAKLLKTLKLPPFFNDSGPQLNKSAMLTLLEVSPISVKPFRQGFECIGGFRLWLLAKEIFDEDDEIPVLLYECKAQSKVLKKRLLVELYQQPFVLGMFLNDTRLLSQMEAHIESMDKTLLTELGLDTLQKRSKWSQVSTRTLMRG